MQFVAIPLFLLYGLAQLVAGYLGIEHHFGGGWAIAAFGVALLFRFTVPITVGSFFGAMNVWGWHWLFALLFVAPGLAFVVPSVLAAVLEMFGRRE